MDGVATHHMGTSPNDETVRKTVELVLAYSRQPTAMNQAAVATSTSSPNMSSRSLIRSSGRWSTITALVTNDCTNFPVPSSRKRRIWSRSSFLLGIALLGLFPAARRIRISSRRSVGTTSSALFCAVALANASDADHEEAPWTSARQRHGLGANLRGSKSTCSNHERYDQVMASPGGVSELGDVRVSRRDLCARAGGLLLALSEEASVDRELLTAAGEIIQALIASGPAESDGRLRRRLPRHRILPRPHGFIRRA